MRALAPLLFLAACVAAQPADPEPVDTDGDGLTDEEEADLGTDPAASDSDGDGFADAAELDCGASPTDGGATCFACGWPDHDPGTLQTTGDEVGDVVADLTLTDACGEEPSLWNWAREYHILYLTAAW